MIAVVNTKVKQVLPCRALNMQEQVDSIKAFWDDLAITLDALQHATLEQLAEQGERVLIDYRPTLKQIDSNLTFHFERNQEEGPVQLVFGCDGYPESIHSVLTLVGAAPKLDGFQVRAFNERHDPVPRMVDMGGELCEINDYWYSLRTLNGKLELAIYMEDAPTVLDMDPRVEGVMFLLDALIGEYEIMVRIWALDWYELPACPRDFGLSPLSQLRSEFDQMKSEIKPIGINLH